MCKDCRDAIKTEIEFLLRILYTPEISKENIEMVNEALNNALLDLYGYEEDEVETTHDYTTTATSSSNGTTVINMSDLFNKES